MKTAIALLFASILAAPAALADRSYQKSGTVVELNDKVIVIATDKEGNWEFKRDGSTKVDGKAKKGGRVTVHYSMSASKVDAKGDGKKK